MLKVADFDFYVRKNQNFLIFPHIKIIFANLIIYSDIAKL